MKETILYDEGYQWLVFGRDPDKPEGIVDTNQFMIKDGSRSMLIEPGGIEIFSSMLACVTRHADPSEITDIFSSHQDPDVISSLGLWDKATPQAKLHAPWLWEGFIRHFGCEKIEYCGIADEGKELELNRARLQLIPAHYLHSPGNFNLYDSKAKILMSGVIGAALEPQGAPVFVEDFDEHIQKMTMFHQRWMPSNRAKNDWVARVRKLDIDILAPQQGRLFKGPDVKRFLDWFEALEVGTGIKDLSNSYA